MERNPILSFKYLTEEKNSQVAMAILTRMSLVPDFIMNHHTAAVHILLVSFLAGDGLWMLMSGVWLSIWPRDLGLTHPFFHGFIGMSK